MTRYRCPECGRPNTYGGDPYPCTNCGFDGREPAALPYTDEQVSAFARAAEQGVRDSAHFYGAVALRALHEAGIEVKFPEPRFVARYSSHDVWHVMDQVAERDGAHPIAASFVGPGCSRYALEHADRLNREVSA